LKPKKTLLVVAHPQRDSLCSRLAASAQQTVENLGEHATVRNLYEIGFDPCLQPQERNSYYASQFDGSLLKKEIAELVDAEVLILVFPTWWFGFPAILKGWFDRVWAPGIAYDHATDRSAIKSKLSNLKHVVAITTLGSPWWVDWLLMGRPVRRVLKTALVGVCAPNASFRFIAQYKAEKLKEPQIQRFEARIHSAVKRVFR